MTGCSANESILDSCLDAYGHSISRDAVRTQMRWLEEQGLLSIEKVGETLVAKLTGRGDDVATGQAVVDGVKNRVRCDHEGSDDEDEKRPGCPCAGRAWRV